MKKLVNNGLKYVITQSTGEKNIHDAHIHDAHIDAIVNDIYEKAKDPKKNKYKININDWSDEFLKKIQGRIPDLYTSINTKSCKHENRPYAVCTHRCKKDRYLIVHFSK